MNLKTGHMLAGGRYKIERVLGQGGFGITYEARDTKFKSRVKSVAIKEFFVKDFCNREEDTNRIIVATQSKVELVEKLRKKFIDEANALFELEHPGIVRVTDTFEENGTAYYVMEYINGSSLSTIIEKDGPLNEDMALGYMRQAAAALEYLHGQNRLHLDIKPHNIMVDNDGRVVLIDFGVSKQYDEVDNANTSTLMGYTPGYAPLEQCNNGVMEFTPTTDIYSLGAVLFKLLTGETPPNASEVNENGLPALPKVISATTCHAIETAMQPRRKDRPQSVGEFLALLDGKMKEHRGKSKDESDGATVVGGSVMNNEILRSTQNDKEQKPVILSEHSDGENTSTNAGETVFNVGIPNVREETPKKRPFNKKLITIIATVVICLVAAFWGVKSCDESRTHGSLNGHEWVDLGLPSGIKWATCNVGASKPEEYGGYYAWGETEEPRSEENDPLAYKWYNGSDYITTKYCTDDNKTVLDPQDDVAHVKWGGSWRMPTFYELQELLDYCTWTQINQNGVAGYLVTGPNGNSIFLPAAGYGLGGERLSGSGGFYWSSSLYSDYDVYAYNLVFASGEPELYDYPRCLGCTVRPVCE